jgi:hypothetical protein
MRVFLDANCSFVAKCPGFLSARNVSDLSRLVARDRKDDQRDRRRLHRANH